MKRNFFLPKSCIGLDINPHGIYLIQLHKTKAELRVKQYGMMSFSEDIFLESRIKRWDRVNVLLTELIQTLKIKETHAIIALPANLVKKEHLSLPQGLSDEAIEAEIYAHVERDLPGINEALCIDFTIGKKETGHADIFFTVTRKAYLEQYIECVRQTGLTVKIVDVDAYALVRAAAFTLPSNHKAGIIALCHILHLTVTFIIFDTQEVLFHQQWQITTAFDTCVQLKRGLQFYLGTQNVLLSTMLLCGDHPYLKDVADYFKEANLSLHYPNLLPQLKLDSHINADYFSEKIPYFLTAFGLAMREVPPW